MSKDVVGLLKGFKKYLFLKSNNTLKREIKITSDGSSTIHIPEWNEQYHSKHGAIQEAYHVFIKHGLNEITKENVHILEIGFGTGLNCFITYLEHSKPIYYTGVEAYPISLGEMEQLNYVQQLKANKQKDIFEKIHTCSWEEMHEIEDQFYVTKRKQLFQEITDKNVYDLVYFDAFGARVQPELWTEDIFRRMYEAMKLDAILVTYAAKGSVRRAMQACGFVVERLPGPPGKREMLRGVKK